MWAIALVQGRIGEAIHRGAAVPLFFVGAMLGAALVDSAEDRAQVRRAFIVEAAFLFVLAAAAFAGGDSPGLRAVMLFLAAAAMGIQNAALTDPGTRGTHTTHITGPLTDLAVDVVRTISPARKHEVDLARTRRLAARIVGFGTGAVCGALLFGVGAAVAPFIVAVVLLVLAERR